MQDTNAGSAATDGFADDWDWAMDWAMGGNGDGDEPVGVVLEAAGSEPFAGRSLLDPRRARVRRLGSIGSAATDRGES